MRAKSYFLLKKRSNNVLWGVCSIGNISNAHKRVHIPRAVFLLLEQWFCWTQIRVKELKLAESTKFAIFFIFLNFFLFFFSDSRREEHRISEIPRNGVYILMQKCLVCTEEIVVQRWPWTHGSSGRVHKWAARGIPLSAKCHFTDKMSPCRGGTRAIKIPTWGALLHSFQPVAAILVPGTACAPWHRWNWSRRCIFDKTMFIPGLKGLHFITV